MSLEKLEQQLLVASMALEKANKSGDVRQKQKIRDELIKFTKVLEKSKARLSELEAIKRECDDFSNAREQQTKASLPKKKFDIKDKSYLEPIVIPWLENKTEKKAGVQPAQVENRDVVPVDFRNDVQERHDVETSSVFGQAMEYGNQIMASMASDVSSLGSQIFGTSEITKAISKENEMTMKNMVITPAKRFSTLDFDRKMQEMQQQLEPLERKFSMEKEHPLEIIYSNGSGADVLSPDYVADQERQAREKYIQLNKEHLALRRSGISEDSKRMQKSARALRDCYAKIEYWESYGEEASRTSSSAARLLGRDLANSSEFDVDREASKARDEYTYAMMHLQSLVSRRVSTNSQEWIDSQTKVQDALTKLQFWEKKSAYSVPPSL